MERPMPYLSIKRLKKRPCINLQGRFSLFLGLHLISPRLIQKELLMQPYGVAFCLTRLYTLSQYNNMQTTLYDNDKQMIDKIIANAPRLRNFGGSPKICVINNLIYSYNTCVAVMYKPQGSPIWKNRDNWTDAERDYFKEKMYVPAYHSTTTSRHINKMAQEYNLEVVKLY